MIRAIGIDIGTTKIKIAELAVAKTRDIVGLYEIERKEDLSIAELIEDFFSINSIQGERIAVGIGNTPVVIRQNTYAFSNSKEIKAAIMSDLEDSLPFDVSDYLIDDRMLWKRGKNRHYIVGLCPDRRISELNETFEAANVIPNSYILDAQALAHLAFDQCLEAGLDGGIYAVVDIGYSATKIAILRGATPEGMKLVEGKFPRPEILELRTIHRGLKDLSSWISRKESITDEEAKEWLKHRAQIVNEDEDVTESVREMSDELKTALRPLLVEIYQTFQSIRGEEDALPKDIYIAGPITSIEGFVPFAGSELRVSAVKWDCFRGYSLDKLPAVSDEKMNSFATALSLAHRYSTNTKVGWLNFRRSSQAQKALITKTIEENFNQETKSGWITVAAVLVFALIYSSLGSHFAEKERTQVSKNIAAEFKRMDANLTTIGSRSSTDLEKATKLFEKEKKMREKELVSLSPRLSSDILIDLSESMPNGYKVVKLSIDNSRSDNTFSADISQLENVAKTPRDKLENLIKNNLSAKGYTNVSLSEGPNSNLNLKALWVGENF